MYVFPLLCFYLNPSAPLSPISFALHTPAALRIQLPLMFLCVTVSQMSCIRLLTRCLSAWLSSPRLYVISPGVPRLCVYVRSRGVDAGLRVSVWWRWQQKHRTILTSLSFEAFFLRKLCLSAHKHTHARAQIWHTDT